jgi:signal transduction histidine kinase
MAGVLIVAPPLLLLFHGAPAWRTLLLGWEYWLVLVFLLATGAVALFAPVPEGLGVAGLLPWFPVMVWAGTRLGSRGAMTASFVVTTSAMAATLAGLGPFAKGDPTEAVILLWAYATVIGLTGFALAAVVEERDAADRRYRSEEAGRLRVEKDRLLLLERQRLTREMHDGLGGQLISTLSMVERGRGDAGEIAEALRRALDDIRIVIDSLDPETTDLTTSLGKLRARLTPALRRNGIELVWNVDDVSGLQGFSPEISLHLLRVIQEAVTNAVRHARPRRVEVSVKCPDTGERQGRKGRLHVCIRDDGCGLPPGRSGGRGIQNMHTRARELGAELVLRDAEPGTRVDLRMPLPIANAS